MHTLIAVTHLLPLCVLYESFYIEFGVGFVFGADYLFTLKLLWVSGIIFTNGFDYMLCLSIITDIYSFRTKWIQIYLFDFILYLPGLMGVVLVIVASGSVEEKIINIIGIILFFGGMIANRISLIKKSTLPVCLYTSGMSGQDNMLEEVKLIRGKAELGDADAQYNLGLSYLNGYGVPQNNIVAEKWLRRAAQQNHQEARRMLFKMKS